MDEERFECIPVVYNTSRWVRKFPNCQEKYAYYIYYIFKIFSLRYLINDILISFTLAFCMQFCRTFCCYILIILNHPFKTKIVKIKTQRLCRQWMRSKGGFPKMSIDYFQSIVLDENVQMLGFLMIASTAGMFSLVCWGPVFIHAALVCS